MDAILNKVQDIIVEQMGVAEEDITPETSFAKDLGADSLDILQIITALEEEYGMEFSNEDAESIKTVGDAVSYIKDRVEGQP